MNNPIRSPKTEQDAVTAVPHAPSSADSRVQNVVGDQVKGVLAQGTSDDVKTAILALHDSRSQNETGRGRDFRIERTSPEVQEFTVVRKNAEGKEIRERFTIECLDSPEHPTLPAAYGLMESVFSSEELDPLDIMQDQMRGKRYGYEMGAKATLFAVKNEQGEVVCTLDGGLLPLRDDNGNPTGEAVFMVFYVATNPKVRQYGIGREIMISAYQQAELEAKQRGLKFIGAAGECTWTSYKYWEKLGWRRVYTDAGEEQPVQEIPYVQPPLAFDLNTGEIEDGAGDAPEHFMIHLFDKNAERNPNLARKLPQIVGAFYKTNNYIDRRAFAESENPEAAYAKHRSAIDHHREQFGRDLGRGQIRFLTSRDCDGLRARDRTIEDWVTSDEEAEAMGKPIVRIPEGNM
ncbi:hypothetical protein HZA39_03295 [Candidatus Peregrinibacteria bacterium]|nr:hypothetical protein [Candidatus Peregrinibacteria bacterium]